MTVNEAIICLSDMKIKVAIPKAAVQARLNNEALDMAIEALKCSEIPNNSDTISRQAMLDGIDKLIKIHFDRTVVLYKARQVAENLPSVQPERKTGRWIESNPRDSKVCRLMTCSECGKAYIVNINVPYEDWTEAHKFCVECGAKMEGGEADE